MFSAFLVGCNVVKSATDGASTGKETPTDKETSTSVSLFTNTSTTTPVFKPQAVFPSSLKLQSTWESGELLYSVYYTLREFLAERDEGKVDRSNLYKLLKDVDNILSSFSSLESIPEAEITPPFNKLQKVVCNSVKNDSAGKKAIAMKETTEEVNAIITWIWGDDVSQNSYGVASVQYNKITKDLIVDMSFSVDYNMSNTATDYNSRCHVSGNAGRNEFQFKYIIGGTKIVAKGISRGEGNYMLFKYQGEGGAAKYIVVPGTADEAYFIEQFTTPTAIYTNPDDLPATVSSYKDWVVAADFFGPTDLLSDISTLNSGNAKQGTIYINY